MHAYLPSAKVELAICNGNAQRCTEQWRLDVGWWSHERRKVNKLINHNLICLNAESLGSSLAWHVVFAFHGVPVPGILGCYPIESIFHVSLHVWIIVFIECQRSRCVLDEQIGNAHFKVPQLALHLANNLISHLEEGKRLNQRDNLYRFHLFGGGGLYQTRWQPRLLARMLTVVWYQRVAMRMWSVQDEKKSGFVERWCNTNS